MVSWADPSSPVVDRLAAAEAVQRLDRAGFGWLIRVLADPAAYKGTGDLNHSAAARMAKMSVPQLVRHLANARAVAAGFGDD